MTQSTLYTHLNGPTTVQGQGSSLLLWAESSNAELGGGNGRIYLSGVISGSGDITALAPVVVNSGTLDLRAQGALGLGSGVQLNGGTLTLNSMDIAGELLSVTAPDSTLDANGPCTWEGSITLDDQLSVYAADSLQLAINGNISGPGGLRFLGQNIGLGGGPNTYSGTTYSLCALLQLNGGFSGWINSDPIMSGPLIIGNASGLSCEVRWENYARLFNASSNNLPPVTLYPGAVMNLNGFEDILGSLTFNGGTVEMGTNGELMPGPVLVNSNSAPVMWCLKAPATLPVPLTWADRTPSTPA